MRELKFALGMFITGIGAAYLSSMVIIGNCSDALCLLGIGVATHFLFGIAILGDAVYSRKKTSNILEVDLLKIALTMIEDFDIDPENIRKNDYDGWTNALVAVSYTHLRAHET